MPPPTTSPIRKLLSDFFLSPPQKNPPHSILTSSSSQGVTAPPLVVTSLVHRARPRPLFVAFSQPHHTLVVPPSLCPVLLMARPRPPSMLRCTPRTPQARQPPSFIALPPSPNQSTNPRPPLKKLTQTNITFKFQLISYLTHRLIRM